MNWKRRILPLAGAVLLALVLLIAGAIYALQTKWFKEEVRERTLSAVEQATGGRAELGSFDYDWRTLSAEFRDFVVHGTESSAAQPLFRADSIRVGLRIVSLFNRDVDVASLIVASPRIHVAVQPDGSTNIPSAQFGRRPAGQTIQNLLTLKIRRFELNNGTIEADSRTLPLSIQGQNVAVAFTYDRHGPRYRVTASSQRLQFQEPVFRGLTVSVDLRAGLERNRVIIERAAFMANRSSLHLRGNLNDFANPKLELQAQGSLSASDIATASHLPGLERGQISVNGAVHYHRTTSDSQPKNSMALFTFEGKVSGHGLAYLSKAFSIANADLQADVAGDPQEVQLTRLALAAPGGRVTGEAKLNRSGAFRFTGAAGGFNLREAGRLSALRISTWSGVASGPIELQGTLANPIRNLAAHGRLHIVPATNGIPVSGDVEAFYSWQARALRFGPSSLNFPNTRVSFSGDWGMSLQAVLDSTNLKDLQPALPLLDAQFESGNLPVLLPNGSAHFDGVITGPIAAPQIAGNLALAHFRLRDQTWDSVRSRISLSSEAIQFTGLVVESPMLNAGGDGRIGFRDGALRADSPIQFHAHLINANLLKLAEYSKLNLPRMTGSVSASMDLQGSLADPQGRAQISIQNPNAFGERLNGIQAAAAISKNQILLTEGRMQADAAVLTFSATYNRGRAEGMGMTGLEGWRTGDLQFKIDSNGFPLATLAPVRQYEPGLNAQFEIHAEAAVRVTGKQFVPEHADGVLTFRNVVLNNVSYGSLTFRAATHDQTLTTTFSGDLRATHLSGQAQVQLVNGSPAKGEVHFDRIGLPALAALISPVRARSLLLDGFVRGGLTFEGPLQQLNAMRGALQLQEVQLSSSLPLRSAEAVAPADFIFRNTSPVVVEIANGVAAIRNFHLGGRQTAVTLTGTVPCFSQGAMRMKVDGTVDMQIFQLFDPNVRSTGRSVISAAISGTMSNPAITGTLELSDGAFALKDLPNGLSAVNGSVKFDRNRATIEKLTAKTGGGDLALGGFVTFGAGPLVYRLEANGANIRLRYGGGISVTASSQLRLTGTSSSSILSGTATVSRVVLNANADVGNLLASVAVPTAPPANQKDFLTGLQLDVRVESAPNLQLSTALSRDVQAEVDLRLRGTPEHPVLLGSIVANQGDIRVFGTRYTINRGEINFVNAVRIEPVLDLDLRTQARGITVDITIAGTLGKLNINYRSDPPLQPRDIIALLTVGRAPDLSSNVASVQATNDVSALQSGAGTVLGQAISPASNRLSKLFGITNIKIDPLVQGTTNTPQARLTLEQQISKEITVTYITNLSQTSEQVFRVEWALSTHYSVVALRDDNGEFGIDLQYRKRFK